MRKRTRKQLEREVMELKASLASTYHFASVGTNKASIDRMTGSSVFIQLTTVGGEEIIPPTAIRDGLSPDTIDAIKQTRDMLGDLI